MERPTWTLDELVELVRTVLSVDYDGPPNGRVRDLPDRRAIRWYSTVGLVDRSTLIRGRTALYGERQLLQVVAIKRRQAQGRSLAEIQQELTGATDDTLRGIARVPADLLTGAPPAPQTPARQRFWAERPAPATVPVSGVALPGGALLVLPAGAPPPGPADLAALADAARPLVEALASRGFIAAETLPTEAVPTEAVSNESVPTDRRTT
jgi:DNA-binding transcriptional MerR regulator